MANKPLVGKANNPMATLLKVGVVDRVPVMELEVGDLLVLPDEHGNPPESPMQVLKVRRTKEFVYVDISSGKLKIPVKARVPVVTAVAVLAVPVAGNKTVH